MKAILLRSILPAILICCHFASAQAPDKSNRVKGDSITPAPASALTFTCGSTVTDIDNNTYNTLLLGTQCWLKENLKVTKNPAGQNITRTCYDNNASNCNTYGGLYTWTTIMNGAASSTANPSGVQGICPNGWHIPSQAEWTQLNTYANTQPAWVCESVPDQVGKALASKTNWAATFTSCQVGNNPSTNNASGFTGVPGGYWSSQSSEFIGINSRAFWWSSTQGSLTYAKPKFLSSAHVILGDSYNLKTDAMAVRCILSPPCADPTTGGTIGSDQNICQGSTPLQISSSALPSGNTGTLEYKWQKSTTSSSSGFTDIGSSNSASYQPGSLSVTTWFKRLARVDCMNDWNTASSSNVVKITVEVTPSSGNLAKSPDQSAVCVGANVSATAGSGSGGNGADMIQYRTKSGGNWSSWSTYTSGSNISTTGKTDVEIKTWRTASYCSASSPNSVSWTVSPSTVGGDVSGGVLVCYGSNSTPVNLTGHTGTVQRWEFSTDGSAWNTVAGATGATYTAVDLTVPTWYRAVVQSGVCTEENSDTTKFTIFANYKISGTAKYNNNPKTPLGGLKVLLRKGDAIVDSALTNTAGYYEFDGLTNGNFGLVIKSAHPSGQWQTWGGVNNTDALLVNNHINNTMPLAENPPVIRTTASVKLPHPDIQNNDYLAIRQAAKSGWGYFDIPKWVFSGTTASANIDAFTLACADVTRDIRGLCAGDVNGSYVPANGFKINTPGLELVHNGNLPLADEMVFPVTIGGTGHGVSRQLGAITLFLDYDPSHIEITNVTMPENGGEEPYFETRDGVLYIGWMSENPIQMEREGTLLLVHARLTEAFRISHSTSQVSHFESAYSSVKSETRNVKCEICFALNDNPLSELADGEGNVISDVKLTVPNGKTVKWQNGKVEVISVYPNPAKDLLFVEYLADGQSQVQLELLNIQGISILKIPQILIPTGVYREMLDLAGITTGVYVLKVSCGYKVEVSKVVVSR